jgi:predicted ATPase/class 3 adenylate cyclase
MAERNLPTGIVTFLLTDVEGSTRAWELEPQQMSAALVRHDAMIESTVREHGGRIVRPRGEGDSRFGVFVRASDAIVAAWAIQRALTMEPWPTTDPLSVRIALHTGETELRDGDYYGKTINRCARLRALAHGGQVLVSGVSAQLAKEPLPAGVELRYLGEHRLKDLTDPERVFQLVGPDLRSEFPRLLSFDAHRHNLAVQKTPLIGRGSEVDVLRQLLLDPWVRLVTITGTGGIGKTRLAAQVAAEMLESFADGVYMVLLAALDDAANVLPAIARSLGVREKSGTSLEASLADFLRHRNLLLVLDNFEQLVEAADGVAGLLSTCPQLKVLITSRAPLRVYGEREVPLSPLSLPSVQAPTASELSEYDAARLFIERAQAVRADFLVTDTTAPTIADICGRLDGLPLAIELAAARVKLLSPEGMLARLDRRLHDVLVGGPRDRPRRQQSMRGAIDWSYDLLDPELQVLFRRLSVFVGGWTLEAAEAVSATSGDVLDGLGPLVDASLVREVGTVGGESRFALFETIREYALEHLARSGDLAATHRRHTDYFIGISEQAAPHLEAGSQYSAWLQALAVEQDNLRLAMRWCLENGETDRGLRLGGAMWRYWFLDGTGPQIGDWLKALLLLLDQRTGERMYRARVLTGAGVLSTQQGEFAQAEALHTEGLALARELGDGSRIAACLHNLGWHAIRRNELSRAQPLLAEAVAVARACGDRGREVISLNVMGGLAALQRDYTTAGALYRQAAQTCQALGDTAGVASAFARQGFAAAMQGEVAEAAQLCEQAVALARDPGHGILAWACLDLAYVRFLQGQYREARALCLEPLGMLDETDFGRQSQSAGLRGLAVLASVSGQAEQALRLFAAAEAIRPASKGLRFDVFDTEAAEHWTASANALGPQAALTAISSGREMSVQQALAYALQDESHSAVTVR